MTITHRSLKKFCCHYYLSDIILTGTNRPERQIILGHSLTPEKISGYIRGRRGKNGRKFETFPPD